MSGWEGGSGSAGSREATREEGGARWVGEIQHGPGCISCALLLELKAGVKGEGL